MHVSCNSSAPDFDNLTSYFAGKLSLSADFDPALSTAPPEQSTVTCSKSGV